MADADQGSACCRKVFQRHCAIAGRTVADKIHEYQGSVKGPAFAKNLTNEREYNLVRNTISLTMLSGSKQTNVIPNIATCNLDVRLLPGEDPQDF